MISIYEQGHIYQWQNVKLAQPRDLGSLALEEKSLLEMHSFAQIKSLFFILLGVLRILVCSRSKTNRLRPKMKTKHKRLLLIHTAFVCFLHWTTVHCAFSLYCIFWYFTNKAFKRIRSTFDVFVYLVVWCVYSKAVTFFFFSLWFNHLRKSLNPDLNQIHQLAIWNTDQSKIFLTPIF